MHPILYGFYKDDTSVYKDFIKKNPRFDFAERNQTGDLVMQLNSKILNHKIQ